MSKLVIGSNAPVFQFYPVFRHQMLHKCSCSYPVQICNSITHLLMSVSALGQQPV